jgi:hypothetical protein
MIYFLSLGVSKVSRRSAFMSLKGRIEELSRKHRQLDEAIAEEQKRPAADVTYLKDLKRQKLRIKEELGYLRTG